MSGNVCNKLLLPVWDDHSTADGVPCHMIDTAENYTNLDNSMLLLVVASFTFIKVMLF